MKKSLVKAISVGGILSFASVVAGAQNVSAPNEVRADELLYQLEQDCGSCHGLTLKGGLGPALLPVNLIEKDTEMLVDTILYGRPGTPMPPWEFEISEAEAKWLVQTLKEGLK